LIEMKEMFLPAFGEYTGVVDIDESEQLEERG
jgi:hypothetical protein